MTTTNSFPVQTMTERDATRTLAATATIESQQPANPGGELTPEETNIIAGAGLGYNHNQSMPENKAPQSEQEPRQTEAAALSAADAEAVAGGGMTLSNGTVIVINHNQSLTIAERRRS